MSSKSTDGHGSKPERVAQYLRVSSEEQVERMSIGTQEEFLEQYSGLYGLKVMGIYREEGVSGTIPMHERPEGGRLLDDAKTGKFDVVLSYKLDRVGRTLLNVVDAHDRLASAGIALRSATEPIDTSNPSGRLIFHMLASFAEFERGTIRERTMHGLHRAFKAGKQTGRLPFAYDVGEDGHFEIVEEEAEIVREIISNIAAGSTLYREASRLNALGVPGPGYKYRGKPRKHSKCWGPSTISKIVNQSAYVGIHRIGINSGEGVVERECPPVVPVELQKQAIERLAGNRRFITRTTDRNYLLSALIKCEICGSSFVSHPARTPGCKPRFYYRCSGDRAINYKRRKGAKGHAPYIPAGWIEDLVWQDVKRFLHNPGEVLERLKEQTAGGDEQSEVLEQRREKLQKRLREKQAEKDRYVKLYAQGHLDDEELGTYLHEVSVEADNIRLLLDSIESQLLEKAKHRQLTETTASWLARLRERVAEVEADTDEAYWTRRELVRLLVQSITAGRNEQGAIRLHITYRFGPSDDGDGNNGGDGDGDPYQGQRVGAISNMRKFCTPTSSVTIPIACIAEKRMPSGSFAPANVPILPPARTATTLMAVPMPITWDSLTSTNR